MKKETKISTYFINLLFFLYFFVLAAERGMSIVITGIINESCFGTAFDAYSFITVAISLVVWLTYTIMFCRENVAYLLQPKGDINFGNLAIDSGIILVSGMVHTQNTTTWLQFIAYGFLLLGMLVYVVTHKFRMRSFLSYLYIVAFSMAIPVVYRKTILESAPFFHIFEAAGSLALIALFTFSLHRLYTERGDDLMFYPHIIAMIIIDVLILIWRWSEEINYFLLVALSATVFFFSIGRLYIFLKRFKARRNESDFFEM